MMAAAEAEPQKPAFQPQKQGFCVEDSGQGKRNNDSRESKRWERAETES